VKSDLRRRSLQFCCRRAAHWALLLIALTPAAFAQLRALPDKEPQRAFTGEGWEATVLLHNPGTGPVEADLCTRLYQASSATAAPLGGGTSKKLTVLPGQTVLESASLTFPPVKAETRFLVRWLDGTNRIIGTTDVMVYPRDLLKPLAGNALLGVLDPLNRIKPLLKPAGVEYQDLEDTGLERFDGTLAIIGPFQSKPQMRESLANRSVKALAQKGVAVVWIQPPRGEREAPRPSFYTVREGKGTVVVVQAEEVAHLAESPLAQLNLIRFARLALHPEPLELPDLTLTQ